MKHLLKIINSKLKILLAICFLAFLVAPNGVNAAGTIIKSPAYLGLNRGLVGCWSFDGSYTKVPDCSGNNNTGTITGATKTAGKIGQALSFDGVNDWVDIGQVLSADKTLPFTMSAWAKSTSSGIGKWRTIVGTNTSFAEIAFSSSNTFSFGQNGGGWWQAASFVRADTWYHIVGIYDGINASLYVDSVLISGPTARTFTNNHGTTLLGRYKTTGDEWMDGLIDDVRVYNRALSAGEIQRLYDIGR